ncbi:MAG: M67 family metallopeptidase [Alphaproteobacteria bacterium]
MTAIGHGPAGPEVTALVLPQPLRRKIETEARKAGAEECCGLLVGHVAGARGVVTASVASPNRAADPRTSFEIDPALLLESQRHLRAAGQVVLGHYHSHPRGPADPSAADAERAWVPGHVWLIAAPDRSREKWTFTAHLALEEKGRVSLRPLEILET